MFQDELAQALRHLSEPDILGTLPIARRHRPENNSTLASASALRKILLDAIDHLKPEEPINRDTTEWRTYTILHERYVLRHSPSQVERLLNLGDRQVRREQKRALKILATAIEPHFTGQINSPSESTERHESVREAVLRLMPAPSLFSLASLFDDVIGVAAVATGNTGTPAWSVNPPGVTVFADRGILSQLLLKMILSNQRSLDEPIQLRGHADGDIVRVTIASPLLADPNLDSQFAYMLAGALGTTLTISRSDSSARFNLRAGGALHSVLVIDDEPMAAELLRTYLAGTEFEVKSEETAEAAIQTSLTVLPDVIVLDVMMPAVDGWAVLQRLRSMPGTQRIPILVYSVLQESSLAEALGATRFLRKPVGRQQWLSVLREVVR